MTKGRVGKIWALSRRKKKTRLRGTVKRTRYWISLCRSLYQLNCPSQVPEARLKVWNKEDIPFGGRGPSQGIVVQGGHSQSMDSGGMQPWALTVLREVPTDWRKANVAPVFRKWKKEDQKNCRPVSLISVSGRMMEQLILETISRHLKEKKTIRNSRHGFVLRKSCLTKPVIICNEIASLMDEWRAVNIVFLDFSKAFVTVRHKILLEKLLKYGLDEQAARLIENWLKGWTWEVIGSTSGWRPLKSGVQLDLGLFSIFLNDGVHYQEIRGWHENVVSRWLTRGLCCHLFFSILSSFLENKSYAGQNKIIIWKRKDVKIMLQFQLVSALIVKSLCVGCCPVKECSSSDWSCIWMSKLIWLFNHHLLFDETKFIYQQFGNLLYKNNVPKAWRCHGKRLFSLGLLNSLVIFIL